MWLFRVCSLLGVCFLVAALAATSSEAAIRVKWDSPTSGPGNDWDHAYNTVAAAIAASAAGDEIWVAGDSAHPYSERITLKLGVGLYGGFAGTETSLHQRDWKANITVLDGGASGTVVTSPSGAASSTILDGFTIRNTGGSSANAGVLCMSSSPTIANNTITATGTGVYCRTSQARITGNSIVDNETGVSCTYSSSPTIASNAISENGSAIFCDSSSPTITANVVSRNGGAIYLNYECSPAIANNTIWANGASGIYCSFYCSPDITNNTIVGNSASGIYCYKFASPAITNNISAFNAIGLYRYGATGTPVLSHNCVYNPGGTDYDGLPAGTGDINADPLFADRASGNFRLLAGSPCIDAGHDPGVPPWLLVDVHGNPRISGMHVDMGACEFQATSIADARGSRDGVEVTIAGAIVTAAWADVLYIEDASRSCGTRVSKASHGLQVGQSAIVSGVTATTADGERMIEASVATGADSEPLRPLGMLSRALGGAATPDYSAVNGTGQQGVAGGAGLNNIGLLVTICGVVQYLDSGGDHFVLSDGAPVSDPDGRAGVRVRAQGMIPPGLAVGDFVTVTGISSCYRSAADLHRRVLVRTADDIVVQAL